MPLAQSALVAAWSPVPPDNFGLRAHFEVSFWDIHFASYYI